MDKLKFALEKLLALVSSQRFLVTIVGIIVIVILAQNLVAGVFGFDPWNAPDEADLTARIEALIGQAVTIITALLSIVGAVVSLNSSYGGRPPTLNRDDYTSR